MGYFSIYPPAHNDTYVKATSTYSTNYWQYYATDPAKSVTSGATSQAWCSANGTEENKFNIDLGGSYEIVRIYLENFHHGGGLTDRGVKDFRIYGTNSAVAFANVTFSDLTDLTLLGSFTAAEHVAADTADPQYFVLPTTGEYRYYIIRTITSYSLGPTYYQSAFRRIELQETAGDGDLELVPVEVESSGGGDGGVVLQPISIAAVGGFASLSLQPISISAVGGGSEDTDLQPTEISATGGGFGSLTLDNITIAAAGRTTTPVSVSGTIPYTITGGFDLNFHTMVDVAGTIPYIITGGFQMDRTEMVGTIPYEITGGFDVHSEVLIDLAGTIPYTITGGFDVSPHIPVSLVGEIPYTLTGGFAVVSGVSDIDIEGTIPYTIEGGFGIKSRAAMEIEGTIPYTIEGGFTIDSGDSCGGTLQYSEDAIC